jgi:hypothetical protein
LGFLGIGRQSKSASAAAKQAAKDVAALSVAERKSFLGGLSKQFIGRVALVGTAVAAAGLAFAAVARHVTGLNVSLTEMLELTASSSFNQFTNIGGNIVIVAQRLTGFSQAADRSQKKLDEINRKFGISVQLAAGDITAAEARVLQENPEKQFSVEQRPRVDEDTAKIQAENAARRAKIALQQNEISFEERKIQLLGSPERVREIQRLAAEIQGINDQVKVKKAELEVTKIGIVKDAEQAKGEQSREGILSRLTLATSEYLAEVDLLRLKQEELKFEYKELTRVELARAKSTALQSRAAQEIAQAETLIDQVRSPAKREALRGESAISLAKQEVEALRIRQEAAR